MNQGPFNSGYIPGPNVLNPPNPIAQLNPYGQSLPNLNYGIPGGNIVGSTNPLLFGSNQNINPVNPIQNSGNVNPFDPNQNFLRQQTYANPMMNPNNNFQSIPNMANNIAINYPDLQINQIMAERMIEREKVKEQTKEIYKRLSDKYDDEQDLEEMKKKQEELSGIFKDLQNVVQEQGTILDRIDYNINISYENTQKGLNSIKKAEEHHNESCFRNAILLLFVIIFVETVLIIYKYF